MLVHRIATFFDHVLVDNTVDEYPVVGIIHMPEDVVVVPVLT